MEENKSQIVIYQTENGETKLDVRFQDETVWLTQKMMAELFQTSVPNINMHLKNIFEEGELEENRTIKEFLIVQQEGNREVKRKQVFYNLDAIISVGYRIKSHVATKFRQWATSQLREYIVKGFVLDDNRLKQAKNFGQDYFDELLERIRSIRTSERRFYQKITDIYAEASIDYDPAASISRSFFKTVQNKLHWAITGKTAAEIISLRADAKKENMGLTTWKNAPGGKILKSDVSIAKNYLEEDEIKALERIVTMYLDFAELQAERQNPMKMADWVHKLDAFLQFNEYEVLQDAGKVTAAVAKKLAEEAYEKFAPVQDKNYLSDFDKAIKKLKNIK